MLKDSHLADGHAPSCPVLETQGRTGEPLPSHKRRSLLIICFIPCAAAVILALAAANPGHNNKPPLVPMAPTTIAVVHPFYSAFQQRASFSGEFRPYQEIDLYAQVAGFVTDIGVDIGDKVVKNQTLATLEIPELEDNIHRAQAVLRQADDEVSRSKAEYLDAHQQYQRLQHVAQDDAHLLAQQDLDDAIAKDQARAAGVESATAQQGIAQAELDRLMTTRELCTIHAPFEGVITKRYADPGSIVRGGVTPSTLAMPLVRLSQNDCLRLSFPVPEHQAFQITLHQDVEIEIPAMHRSFHSKVMRFSRHISEDTRTMLVEIDVANADLSIIPGMFANASLLTQEHGEALAIPVSAVMRANNGSSVWLVDDHHQLREQHIELGMELPDRVEVVSGLTAKDEVVVGSRAQMVPGMLVSEVWTNELETKK